MRVDIKVVTDHKPLVHILEKKPGKRLPGIMLIKTTQLQPMCHCIPVINRIDCSRGMEGTNCDNNWLSQ